LPLEIGHHTKHLKNRKTINSSKIYHSLYGWQQHYFTPTMTGMANKMSINYNDVWLIQTLLNWNPCYPEIVLFANIVQADLRATEAAL